MDFSFTDLDRSFRDGAREVLAARGGPDHIRAAWDRSTGPASRQLWQALGDLGLLDAVIPEDEGGLGLDEQALVLIFEESGYSGMPEPLVETVALAAPLLGKRYAGSGGLIASDLGGPLVPWAADADLLLLGAPDGSLHLVEPGRVDLEPVATVDGARRACRVRWEPRPASDIDAPAVAVERARQRATLATAAQLIGLGRVMLDLTVAYVSQREQFGTRVGAFQAVKHRLADAATGLEFARPVVRRAAWSLAANAPEAARDVSMAKVMAGDAAALSGRASLQCHGAIGYTTEYDLHLYLKRTWALAGAWGDSAHHRDRVGTRIGA